MSVSAWRTCVPQSCGDQDRGQRGQVLGSGEICRGVVEPDMQLRFELVDHHGAALDEIRAVVDQDA
jgi:hypothetical protein